MNHRNRFEPDANVLKRIPDLAALSGREIDKRARDTAEALVKADRVKTHQLRNIYASIDRIRSTYQQDKQYSSKLEDELFLLKPKLAYAAGRQRAVNATLFPFMNIVIDGLANATEEDKDKAIRNFFALLESVVGYHKYFENNKKA